MKRIVLRAKIHRVCVTGLALEYEGSITVDQDLLDRAGMVPGEQVHVLNLNNGTRFVTYLIAGRAGSGEIILNGPAARLGEVGDQLIILTYGIVEDEELPYAPKVVVVDDRNRPLPEGR